MQFLYGLSSKDKKELALRCLRMFEADIDNESYQEALIKAADKVFPIGSLVPTEDATINAIGPDDIAMLDSLGFYIKTDQHQLAYLRDGTDSPYYAVLERLFELNNDLGIRVLSVLMNHNGLYLPYYLMKQEEMDEYLEGKH